MRFFIQIKRQSMETFDKSASDSLQVWHFIVGDLQFAIFEKVCGLDAQGYNILDHGLLCYLFASLKEQQNAIQDSAPWIEQSLNEFLFRSN